LYENFAENAKKGKEEKEHSIIHNILVLFCVEKIIKFREEFFFGNFLPHLDFAFSLLAILK